MPLYLKSIGFSIMIIGLLEGIAESITGLSKGYFGQLSDTSGRRKPFVQLGYAISSVSKPLLVLFINPIWVFLMRTSDRLGKGIRTASRDAILSDESTPETKGQVFGFHRSMDTLGAVIGPVLALIFLYFYPENYKPLFLIAFIPGTLAVASTFFLKEKESHSKADGIRINFFSFLKYWKNSPPAYRKLTAGLLAFALFNSSDVFLLLKARQAGMNDINVIGLYILYNLIYAISAFPFGVWSDKIGFKKTYLIGLSLFALVYLGISLTDNHFAIMTLLGIYGLYSGAVEGVSKAWICQTAEPKDTATAIGTYAGFQSICTLIASSFAGWVWFNFGAGAPFMITGIVTILIIQYFLFWVKL